MNGVRSNLLKLEERRRTLDARIQRIRARTAREERRRDARRKIIAGAFFIKLLGGDLRRVGHRLAEAHFLDPRDRELFGLTEECPPPLEDCGN